MGRVVEHEACPRCRTLGKDSAGDNLGVFEDGGKYCIACGWVERSDYVPPPKLDNLPEQNKTVLLPEDVSVKYPNSALRWINDYELTKNDLFTNRALWSELYSRLIFPIYSGDTNVILGWQGRYFGDHPRPKWFSRGNFGSIYHVLPGQHAREVLTLVEDVVSAIKISKAGYSAMPLFGSYLAADRVKHLKFLAKHVNLWLDPDKHKEAIEFAVMCNSLGLSCSAIFSTSDPKEHSYPEIVEFIEKT